MSETRKRPQATLVKVADNLYRNSSSEMYYALVKRSGKQIRKSLKTTDSQLASRRSQEFREKADHILSRSGKIGQVAQPE